MLALIETVNHAMEDFAPAHLRPPQKCMMRIYRDIRFSSDKRPYKSHVSAWWSRAGLEKTSGGGYYMHVSPDEVLIAAGVYMPEREQLLAIRRYLAVHHVEVRRLLNDRKLRRTMESFSGVPLTRAPKGFPKDHPAMDLLLCRQWGVEATLASKRLWRRISQARWSGASDSQLRWWMRSTRLCSRVSKRSGGPCLAYRKRVGLSKIG